MVARRGDYHSQETGQGLEILYRDSFYAAIHKPAGLLIHRTGIDRHEQRFAVQLLRDQIGRRVYPVHRLDKPTSGVLLFALSESAARAMAAEFTAGRVDKHYLAVVRGHTASEGRIEHPLREIFDPYADRAKPCDGSMLMAVTCYRRLDAAELPVAVDRYPTSRYTLLEIRPLTGRRHQIRRHMKHIAHPVIGDTTHGKSVHNRFFERQFGCRRLLLAATRLQFRHPLSGKACVIDAPPADDMLRVIRALGWSLPDHDTAH